MTIDVAADEVRLAAYGLTIPDGADLTIDRLVAKAIDRLPGGRTGIETRVAAGTLDEGLVKGVIEDMVIRVLSNPRALRSTSIDDYSETIDAAVSSGALYLSDSERALLTQRTRPFIGSVRIGIPAWRIPGA